MNRRFAATMELQRPEYRDPASLIGRDVCPHCKRLVTLYCFYAPDGHPIKTHRCIVHGDVVPMRSLVSNFD
jgi:hypothetical protein